MTGEIKRLRILVLRCIASLLDRIALRGMARWMMAANKDDLDSCRRWWRVWTSLSRAADRVRAMYLPPARASRSYESRPWEDYRLDDVVAGTYTPPPRVEDERINARGGDA
jgi:hypothetical protein